MNKSSCVLLAALAASVLSAAPAVAAVAEVSDPARRGAVPAPGGVTAAECFQGGGALVIELDRGTGSFVARCQGGVHDGRPVV
ncbi:hypothetical protein [Streptomyces sp. NPDC006134]|uniref:hypothetical protein n=1 Tax=Streptomyces sp. NPDC006134 TaxID=3154467 RepID=UPI003406769C